MTSPIEQFKAELKALEDQGASTEELQEAIRTYESYVDFAAMGFKEKQRIKREARKNKAN